MNEKIHDRGRLDPRRKMSLLFPNMRDQLLYVYIYNNYDDIKQGIKYPQCAIFLVHLPSYIS
jgi:hypothetical protein